MAFLIRSMPYTYYDGLLSNLKMVSPGMLRRVALVRTDVSEELSASFIRITRIGELALFLVNRFLSPR
jgi:hypothetical protein